MFILADSITITRCRLTFAQNSISDFPSSISVECSNECTIILHLRRYPIISVSISVSRRHTYSFFSSVVESERRQPQQPQRIRSRDLCSNQQFQKRRYAKLEKFRCGKKGYGLRLLDDIFKGYAFEVYDMHNRYFVLSLPLFLVWVVLEL
ncbi:H3-K4 specific histone methyltransferase, partial [Prunus dulcis]